MKPVDCTPDVEAARLSKGDFLISRSNTSELVGLVGIFNEDRDDVSFPDLMMRITVDETRLDKRFLEQVLLSSRGRRQMQRIAAGTSTSMVKINRVGLSSLLIPLLPLDRQHKIMGQLDLCTNARKAAETRLENCRRLKQALLNRLLVNHLE